MRVRMTIEDPIVAALRATAQRTGKSYQTVVNEALRLGISAMARPGPRNRLTASRLGAANPAADLDKALALADTLEDRAITPTLTLHK